MKQTSIFNVPSNNNNWRNESWTSVAATAIDAAAEKLFFYGTLESPDWKSGTKDITQVRLVCSAVTQGTGTTTVRVGLSDIALGTPPRDDGVLDQSGTIALTGLAANTMFTITLDAPRTVSVGARLGVVVEFSEFGTGPSLQIRTMTAVNATGHSCGISEYFGAGPSWFARTGYPNVVFICSDGSQLYFRGAFGAFTGGSAPDFNSGSTGTGLTNGDERGIHWVPKADWLLDGLSVPVRVANADADFDMVLYRDTTVIWSKSYVADSFASVGAMQLLEDVFDAPVRVNAGENIRFTMKPTTTNNVRLLRMTFHNEVDKLNFYGGSDAENAIEVTNRVDGGAWNRPTGAESESCSMDLFGYEIPGAPALSEINALIPRPLDDAAAGSLSYNTHLLDASGEKAAYIFQVAKTGNIRSIRFKLGTVTTGDTLKLGLYTVGTDGKPTTTPYGGMVAGTVVVSDTDDNLGKTVTLGTDASAVRGDIVAVVIEFDAYVAGNLNLLWFRCGTSNTSVFPYGALYTAGAWVTNALNPALAIEYDDGSYALMPGVMPLTEGTSAYVINNSAATYDAVGLLFTLPTRVRIAGIRGAWRTNTDLTTHDIALLRVSDNAVLASKSLNAEVHGRSTEHQRDQLFTTPYDAEAGVAYRLVVIATSASPENTTLNSMIAPSAAALKQITGLDGASFCLTRRTRATGVWDDASNTGFLAMSLVVTALAEGGPDISGTHTISGTVEHDSVPVSGAVVRLIRQTDNGILSTLTDGSGNYSFSVQDGYLYHAVAEVEVTGQKYNYKSLFDLTPVAP